MGVLVISRYPRETVVIGDGLFITVGEILQGAVELEIDNTFMQSIYNVHVEEQQRKEIEMEVSISFLGLRTTAAGPQVMLGILAPRQMSVHREEQWKGRSHRKKSE